jgi:N-acetylglucosamine kinase-like BadF-type ATPase
VRTAHAQAGTAADEPVAAAAFYLANVDLPDEEAAMHAALAERGVARQLEVGNDTFAVLRAGSVRGWGIAVVSGAGINAVGRHPDGRVERFLGIGPWSGDWGGSEGIVRGAVAAAVRAGDGRGPATSLAARLVTEFGMPVEDLAFAAHHRRIEFGRLVSFAPAVFEEAHGGDDVARELVERVGDEVVNFAAALARRMDLAAADVDVVLGGRLLQVQDPLMMQRIRSGLAAVAPAARIQVLDVAPVVGALAAALELGGVPAARSAGARAYLLG